MYTHDKKTNNEEVFQLIEKNITSKNIFLCAVVINKNKSVDLVL